MCLCFNKEKHFQKIFQKWKISFCEKVLQHYWDLLLFIKQRPHWNGSQVTAGMQFLESL
jgi:hypothetical protein